MKPKLMLGVAGIALVGLVAGAVGTSYALQSADRAASSASSATPHGADFEQIVSPLKDRLASADAAWLTRSLREVLPNVKFSYDGSEPMPEFEGIVDGRVVAVSQPRAFHDEFSQNSVTVTEVDPNAKDVSWGLVELTIEVANDFDRTTETPAEVVVGLPVFNLGEEARALTDLQGQHVIVAYDRSDPFPADPDLLFVARNGSLLGSVAEDGRISLPVLGEEEKDFVGEHGTLKSLIAASEEPEQVIQLKDGVYTREGE